MTDDTSYDMIVVGSGNGACGFLSYYLQASADERILSLRKENPSSKPVILRTNPTGLALI